MLYSCRNPKEEAKPSADTSAIIDAPSAAKGDTLSSVGPGIIPLDSAIILKLNKQVLTALATKNYKQFATFIHPQKGVRFSFYGYIDSATDRSFLPAQFEEFTSGAKKSQKLIWGTEMEGDKVYLTWADYCKGYVYDKEYLHADTVAYNKIVQSTIDPALMQTIYPSKPFVDNHFPGFEEKYGGMDWKSLRLVFDTYNGDYRLIGVINDEWTP